MCKQSNNGHHRNRSLISTKKGYFNINYTIKGKNTGHCEYIF